MPETGRSRQHMELLVELENYLHYMGQLGIAGLALERNPFQPAPVRTPSALTAVAAPSRATSVKSAPAASPRPERQRAAIPNLVSLMETVEDLVARQDNRALAATVQAPDSVTLLRNLYKTFENCQACALATTRARFVFGEGNPDADLMIVGEGPDKEDNLCGRPFTGPSGELLTRMIEAMNLQRKDVFIANVVKCMPPDRPPLPDETNSCGPILDRQIEAVDPRIIIAMGPTAYSYFQGSDSSLVRGRGHFFKWKKHLVMPTYHPSYILLHPVAKREVWADLRQVMARLAG